MLSPNAGRGGEVQRRPRRPFCTCGRHRQEHEALSSPAALSTSVSLSALPKATTPTTTSLRVPTTSMRYCAFGVSSQNLPPPLGASGGPSRPSTRSLPSHTRASKVQPRSSCTMV